MRDLGRFAGCGTFAVYVGRFGCGESIMMRSPFGETTRMPGGEAHAAHPAGHGALVRQRVDRVDHVDASSEIRLTSRRCPRTGMQRSDRLPRAAARGGNGVAGRLCLPINHRTLPRVRWCGPDRRRREDSGSIHGYCGSIVLVLRHEEGTGW